MASAAAAPAPTLPPQPPAPESAALRRGAARPRRNVVSYTSAIAHHTRSGNLHAAAQTLSTMLSAGVPPNDVSLLTLLSACADSPSAAAVNLAEVLHSLAVKLPLLSPPADPIRANLTLSTALVKLYFRARRPGDARKMLDRVQFKSSVTYNTAIAGFMFNGDIDSALSIFDEMSVPDKISYTAVIDGCVKNGHAEAALDYFRVMQYDGIEPDYVTVIMVIAAIAEVGALNLGLWIHRYVMENGLIRNVKVANSLVDMYARCGRADFAKWTFDVMLERTLVSWNSIIVGFATNGYWKEALEYFDMMRKSQFVPDGVTFTGVLTACSHSGLTKEGLWYYDLMIRKYKITPRIEHFGCVVDLLARAARIDEAIQIVRTMPMKPNEVILGSLLAACRIQGDIMTAEKLMEFLAALEPDVDANYVILSNIYAAIGRWDGVGDVRNMMKAQGINKKPGFSAVEIGGESHEFVAGDKLHCQADEIYEMLKLLHIEMRRPVYECMLEDD